METFEQLVDAGRATVQRLKKNGEISSSFLQAGAAIKVHDCLKFQDLLKSFSFSDDKGLIRVVSNITSETPVQHIVSQDLKRQLFNHQKEKRQPVRMDRIQAKERQGKPFLPLRYDSLPMEHIVQNIFDRVRQDMKTELPGHQNIRVLSSETFLSTEKKETGQSSSIASGDTRNRPLVVNQQDSVPDQQGFVTNQQNSVSNRQDSVPDQHLMSYQKVAFNYNQAVSGHIERPLTAGASAYLKESEKNNWFKKHPEHGHAAVTALSMEKNLNISVDTLKEWTIPFSDETIITSDGAGYSEKNIIKEDRAAKGKYTSSKNLVDAKKLSQPASAGQKETKQFFSGKDIQSSQLEQLVKRWEDKPSQIRDKKLLQSAAGTKTGEPAGGNPVSVESPDESKDERIINRQTQSPVDSDQLFITTLERVLKREIRRYGMEEKE